MHIDIESNKEEIVFAKVFLCIHLNMVKLLSLNSNLASKKKSTSDYKGDIILDDSVKMN